MHIQFGKFLDGLDPTPPKTAIGEIAVGPKGLIRILESDLGLPPVLEHPAEQLVTFRGCLEEADNPERFYHRSLSVDPIAVARTLHHWREQWYLAGWDGSSTLAGSLRVKDMTEVERFASVRVPLCEGQRVARILESLASRRTQIETLTLHTELMALPAIWRQLIERLGYEPAEGLSPTPAAKPGSDLFALQKMLFTQSEGDVAAKSTKFKFTQDGSFIVLRSASRDISARAVAEMLRSRNDPQYCVVIAERDGIIIDNAMERSGLPRCGFQHYSRFRAVSQVLKLCLALLWEPINPHLLLQFLLHPLAPVRGNIRRALGDAVSQEPGVGGRAWNAAIAGLENELRDRGASDSEVDAVRPTIADWFESERFDPEAMAPIAAIAGRVQQVSNWLAARLSSIDESSERAIFANAAAQAEALLASLQQMSEQGRSELGKIELERLVDEVTTDQPDPTVYSEAGRVRATSNPGNINQQWRRIVWWDLAAANHDLRYPWSEQELQELRAAGVDLPSVKSQLRHRNREWLKPILNCTEQLVLAVHHGDKSHHPLWSQISALFSGWAELELEEMLLNGNEPELPLLGVALESLDVMPLPGPKRWWDLPEEVALPPREVESYSSLSKLFYSTHEWVLNYSARLRPGKAEDLPDGPLLYGNLAHRLFEEFFNSHPSWRELDIKAISKWLNTTIPKLISEEGAVLLEPGRGVDHEQVVATLERALIRLVDHLRDANIVGVCAEKNEEEIYLDGLRLRGTIDLLLTREDGKEVVLDSKWGSEKRRGDELEANVHLQLANYAYLRKTATGANQWPDQAYFIISTGNVLAADDQVFSSALVRSPREGVDVVGLWSQSEASYRWRRGQLDSGMVEVNVTGAEATNRSEPPEDGLETRVEPNRFDDFKRLTGWDELA